MIGRLNHVAIAVRDLSASSRLYRETLGAKVSAPLPQPDHGVTVGHGNVRDINGQGNDWKGIRLGGHNRD